MYIYFFSYKIGELPGAGGVNEIWFQILKYSGCRQTTSRVPQWDLNMLLVKQMLVLSMTRVFSGYDFLTFFFLIGNKLIFPHIESVLPITVID